MIGIYKITNLINQKCYIGQSVNITQRFAKHKRNYNSGEIPSLYNAFKKYGIDNFSFEIIEECDLSLLDERERYWIQHYDSFYHGYNQTLGGTGRSNTIDKENIIGVITDLETTAMLHRDIAKKWNISQSMVQGINMGKHWRQDNKEYPLQKRTKLECLCIDCRKEITKHSERCIDCYRIYQKDTAVHNQSTKYNSIKPLELAKMVIENNFTIVGEYFGVTPIDIQRLCKTYQIPHTTKELKAWYTEQVDEAPSRKKVRMPNIRKVNQYSLNDEYIKTFDSLIDAANSCGRSDASNISKACRGVQKTAHGFKWKYAK